MVGLTGIVAVTTAVAVTATVAVTGIVTVMVRASVTGGVTDAGGSGVDVSATASVGGAVVGSFAIRAESTLIDPGLDTADHGFFDTQGFQVPGAEGQKSRSA